MWNEKDFMSSGQEPITFLRKGKANLSLAKFNKFWNDQNSLGFYLAELIKYYCEMEKAKKVLGVSIESTIATMYSLVLSGCYNSASLDFIAFLEDAKQRWEAFRNSHESPSSLLDEIITSVINVPFNPEDHIHLVFAHSLIYPNKAEAFVDIVYKNYLGQEFKIVTPSDISNYASKGFVYLSTNPRFCIQDKGEFIMNYLFIKNFINANGYLPVSILDLFHRKIQEIIISLRSNNYKHAQSSLLPLLHMLKNLLTKYPIISYDSMDALIIDLDIIRRWPIPYGSTANTLLQQVIKEIKAPGSAMRYKIRSDFPYIDSHCPIHFEKYSNPQYSTSTFISYIVVDVRETLESGFFYKLCKFNNSYNKDKIFEMLQKVGLESSMNLSAVYAHTNRCLIVLFYFSLFIEITIADLSHIAGLSSESIFCLYSKILEMVEVIENEEIDRARNYAANFIQDLFEESMNLKSDKTNSLTEPLFVFLSEHDIFFPKLSLYELNLIDLSEELTSRNLYQETEIAINESGYSISDDDPLLSISKRFMTGKDTSVPSPLKIILTGSDPITHRFLRSYIYILETKKNLFSNLEIQFFIVPSYQTSNTLAMYLASIDSWYTRHVYIPFFARPWVPRLDTKSDLKTLSKKDTSFIESLLKSLTIDSPSNGGLNERSLPIVLSDSLLQDYLSEAQEMVPINIFKLKCSRTSNLSCDEVIPMCLYLEIGASVVAKRLQETNSLLKGKNFSEIVENKAFRFRSISLLLQMNQMDLIGNNCGIDEGVVKNVYNLCIANVPRESDRGMMAVPQAEWLELTLIEKDGAEQEANLLKNVKNKKIKDPQNQINIAVNSLYSNLHVSGGRVMANENEFDILVDGVLYGPFKQVIIEPWFGLDSMQVTFPIFTFLETSG